MESETSSFGPTAWAAWWGAAVATLVLIWDIFKWWTEGPRLFVKVLPNRIIVSDMESSSNEKFIFVQVENRGTRMTEITNLSISSYKNFWDKLLKRNGRHWFVKQGNIPYQLNSGARWKGLIPQEETKNNLNDNWVAYIQVFYTGSNKPASQCFKNSDLE